MTGLFKLIAVVVVAMALAAPPVAAQAPNAQERAEQAIWESVQRILGALQMLMQSVPQYEAPEVLDNGDIIIRRKRPVKEPKPGGEGEDETAP